MELMKKNRSASESMITRFLMELEEEDINNVTSTSDVIHSVLVKDLHIYPAIPEFMRMSIKRSLGIITILKILPNIR
jgi:hypothetical protein